MVIHFKDYCHYYHFMTRAFLLNAVSCGDQIHSFFFSPAEEQDMHFFPFVSSFFLVIEWTVKSWQVTGGHISVCTEHKEHSLHHYLKLPAMPHAVLITAEVKGRFVSNACILNFSQKCFFSSSKFIVMLFYLV